MKMVSFGLKYAAETLKCQQAFFWVFKDLAVSMKRVGFTESPDFTVQAVGANALQPFGTPKFWTKDIPPPDNWKFAPDGSIITNDAWMSTVIIGKTV